MKGKKEKFEEINKKLFPTLVNKNKSSKKFIITFFGVPGSGKTTLSKDISKKYDSIIINNDKIREIIIMEKLVSNEEEKENLLQEYNKYLLKNFPFKNKRIVLDKSMDRRYLEFKKIFEEEKLPYFLIRINSSEKIALQKISKREEITNQLKRSMKRWLKDYDFSKLNFNCDLTINSENPNLKKLFNKLDLLLNS